MYGDGGVPPFEVSFFPITVNQDKRRKVMPGRRKDTIDVREILRRIRQERSDRAIAREAGTNRKSIGRHHTWAKE